MDLTLVAILKCPNCSHPGLKAHSFASDEDGRCERGVLVCPDCSSWYPIAEFILELLPQGCEEPGSRYEFFERNRGELEGLGLRAPERSSAVDPAFSEQAHQREHFDQLAVRGDQYSYRAFGQLAFQQALRRLTVDPWRSMIAPGSLVLDIGCADGISSFGVAKPGIKVLGFDISRKQIALATARARSEGLLNTTFMVANADAIPVADRAVDYAVCFGSLHHVPNPARTLHEAARVLVPGGLYLGAENKKTLLRPIFDLLMRLRPIWLEEAGPEAQMDARELELWAQGSDLQLRTRPTVYVPPHLVNRLTVERAYRLLRWTDSFFGRIPVLRNWAGMIEIEARKVGGADGDSAFGAPAAGYVPAS